MKSWEPQTWKSQHAHLITNPCTGLPSLFSTVFFFRKEKPRVGSPLAASRDEGPRGDRARSLTGDRLWVALRPGPTSSGTSGLSVLLRTEPPGWGKEGSDITLTRVTSSLARSLSHFLCFCQGSQPGWRARAGPLRCTTSAEQWPCLDSPPSGLGASRSRGRTPTPRGRDLPKGATSFLSTGGHRGRPCDLWVCSGCPGGFPLLPRPPLMVSGSLGRPE